MKTIVLTGGGTAGHTTPNLALIPYLRQDGWEVKYIGSKTGIEKGLVEGHADYYGISCGKLRRYFSLKNFTDPFKVLGGFFQSLRLIGKLKPDVVFSKGGFVSVPVCLASKVKGVPVVLHESDITPGLANRLASRSAKVICLTFPDTVNDIKDRDKAVVTGPPMRSRLFEGDRDRGLRLCGFKGDKPVLLAMGGSLGAVSINNAIRAHIDELTEKYDIVHLVGKGHMDKALEGRTGYAQFEYLSEELPDVFAMVDMVVSRAGANAIFELLALKKPMLLIPLSMKYSRGDQIKNAQSFAKHGYCILLMDEDIAGIMDAVDTLDRKREELISNMENCEIKDGTQNVLKVIYATAKRTV